MMYLRCWIWCVSFFAVAFFGLNCGVPQDSSRPGQQLVAHKIRLYHVRLSPDGRHLSFIGAPEHKSPRWPCFYLINVSARSVEIYERPTLLSYEWCTKTGTRFFLFDSVFDAISVYDVNERALAAQWSPPCPGGAEPAEAAMPDIRVIFPHYSDGRIYALVDAGDRAKAETLTIAELCDQHRWRPIVSGSIAPAFWNFLDEGGIICTALGEGGEEIVSIYNVRTGERKDIATGAFLGHSRRKTYIIYQGQARDGDDVFLQSIETGKRVLLDDMILPGVFSFAGPFAWSRDDGRIAYVNRKGIYIYDVLADKGTQLTNDPGDIPWDWSEEGYVIFSRMDRIYVQKESEECCHLVFAVDEGIGDAIGVLNGEGHEDE